MLLDRARRGFKTTVHLAYIRESYVDSAFHAIWLVTQLWISLHYSHPDKNKMASRYVPVTDEQIFVTKRSCRFTKHDESHNVSFNSV
jgi:hypothetical protein